MTSTDPDVIHVVPQDIARGAQRYADMIIRQLEDSGRHRLLTLFESDVGFLNAEISLDVRSGLSRRLGLDPMAVRALRLALADARPDLVVAHGGEALKYTVPSLPPGTKLVYLRIGVASAKASNPIRDAVQRRLLRAPDEIVAVSSSVRDELIERYGVDARRVRVIPNARDEGVFVEAPGRSSQRSPRLVFVGHFTTTKRPEVFVEVVRELRRWERAVSPIMIGDGPLLQEIRESAESVDVEVLGRRRDIPDLLRDADVFLFTSRSEGEGMPGVLIEAALSAVPIVTTDVPGARDVVDDTRTGFVVPEDRTDLLAERVAQLLADDDLRAEMGRKARQRAVERFTLKATEQLWKETFERLLRGA